IRDRATETISHQDFYAHCQSRNFQYGPSFQVMQSLSKNNGEVISHLKLPAFLESDFSKFVFHPSMLDGALQGGIAVGKSSDPASQGAALPFSLGQIQLFRPLKSEMIVYGRRLESKGGPAISRNEAFLLDEEGNVLAVLRDFLSRIIPKEETGSANQEASENSLLYAVPEWVPISNGAVPWIPGPILLFDNEKDLTANLVHSLGQPVFRVQAGSTYRAISADVWEINPADAQHYNQLFEELLVSNRVPSLILHCWSVDQTNTLRPEKRIEVGLYSLFNLTQTFVKRRNPKPLTICFVHSQGTPYDEMTDGFLRSLNLESSAIRGATVQIRERVDLSGIFGPTTENQTGVSQFRRVSGGWEARRLKSVAPEKSGASQIKSGGVYLITGGLGGIGKMLATYLAERYQAVLLLCGRSQLSDENSDFLNELRSSGATVSFQQCDISDLAQVTDLVLHAKTHLGGLNGVFHCAGILKDGAFSRKSFEQFEAVLRPKVSGATNLDLATVAEPLDFFVLFSSITALIGNRGQTDYSSANRYLDSFAAWRRNEYDSCRRNGKTISINWPLWAEGGMTLPEPLLARMRASTGMSPVPAKAGFQALECALSFGKPEFAVFFGDKLKLRELLKIEECPAIDPVPEQTTDDGLVPRARTPATPDHTVASIQSVLISILAEALKFSPEELDPDAEMSEYGVDSITAMDILNRCETRFERPIDPSAIVEFPSIRTLSQHLFDLGFDTKDSVPAALPVIPTDQPADPSHLVDPGTIRGTEIIAVIGYACRLPASPNVEAYWENLKNGRTLVTEVPSDRWRWEDHYSPDKTAARKSISKWGGYVNGVDMFDPDFFKIDDIDARVMDPQHRIVMELSEELFQDSGYGRNEIKGKNIGIFMGGGESSYLDAHHPHLTDEELKHLVVNSAGNMMAARISDFYDLRGPASVMDTACSSSLVSVHTACQSIRAGECEWAIAGGAQLLPDYGPHVAFSKAGVLAPDGIPRVFDRKSNGFVLGEGFGLILLKPLEAALRDGDDIRALILGSAVNNDGHTMGVTTPNMRAQSEVLRKAYKKAGIRTSSVGMLEAHGTGTLLGDPIEIKADSVVFRQDSQDRQFCAVGSVKSNLGHLLR
ncbi:MAG: hypothetical protein JWM99_1565, partial [Verrucomicrobiales bacterium]|nr:hypothetical protein [Verrucomicrobiales bacterium]